MHSTAIRCILASILLVALLSQPADASNGAGRDNAGIQRLVERWVHAWRNGRFDAYLDYYIDGYKGGFASHAAWRKNRRDRIDGRDDIRIDIGTVLVRFDVDDPDTAQAVFVQTYRSDTWCDVVEKALDLSRTPSGWRIRGERSNERRRC